MLFRSNTSSHDLTSLLPLLRVPGLPGLPERVRRFVPVVPATAARALFPVHTHRDSQTNTHTHNRLKHHITNRGPINLAVLGGYVLLSWGGCVDSNPNQSTDPCQAVISNLVGSSHWGDLGASPQGCLRGWRFNLFLCLSH